MRAGERIMRERQLLINQITIMASIKELAQKQFGDAEPLPIVMRCDAAIQVTSRLLRGMPIDQEETNVSKTV